MAESKTGTGIDQWLLSRRNITGIEEVEGTRIINVCLGTGLSGVNKHKYLTRAIQDQVSNSDGTFNMLRQEKPESSRNRQRYKSCK